MRRRSPRRSDVPAAARALLDIPNVGPATALDLVRLGIASKRALAGRSPERLYRRLCALDGVRHDPCVLDVFASAVAFAEGGPPRPWWEFSAARKRAEERAAR